jgi:hypothetical protein
MWHVLLVDAVRERAKLMLWIRAIEVSTRVRNGVRDAAKDAREDDDEEKRPHSTVHVNPFVCAPIV